MTAEGGERSRWVDLATARDQLEAEIWCNMLVQEGVSAMVRPGDTSSFLGVRPHPTGVRVLETDLDKARDLLAELTPDEARDEESPDPLMGDQP